MSANIPSTMPMSDLLKSTGYNCPAELQGKTFDEATSGGDTKISTSTAATVDVSAYTEPVEIEPAEGYDATKKVTLTLNNIPSGADLEANHAATIDVSTYTDPVEITPTQGKDGMAKTTVTLTNIPQPSGSATAYAWSYQDGTSVGTQFFSFSEAPDTLSGHEFVLTNAMTIVAMTNETPYEKITNGSFTIDETTFTRDITKDFTLWQTE